MRLNFRAMFAYYGKLRNRQRGKYLRWTSWRIWVEKGYGQSRVIGIGIFPHFSHFWLLSSFICRLVAAQLQPWQTTLPGKQPTTWKNQLWWTTWCRQRNHINVMLCSQTTWTRATSWSCLQSFSRVGNLSRSWNLHAIQKNSGLELEFWTLREHHAKKITQPIIPLDLPRFKSHPFNSNFGHSDSKQLIVN